MKVQENLECLADDLRRGCGEIQTHLTPFPSGGASLDVRVGGRAFVIDYLPSHAMFGVEELTDEGGFDSGYRYGFADFPSARAKFLEMLAEAVPQAPTRPATTPGHLL